MASMCLTVITMGCLAYADKIAVDECDPLSILIAQEDENENDNPFPHESTLCWATTE
jgi:hypothetical protein